ncbi:helix-turn-helix transcriptional regulator [Pedobacter sp. BS3]|uniref:helix-turn-helix domain-containing protein n=1 Tax=Pedobacter sp. BS3 TaxID=2567937 RepID=UPI0011EFE05C|nr:helix-turn-helix transcriptional regulator [Pedobacter sp. BS3]TZF82144.1 helix-turn-helix transcriptional regulator [Pedobacter sp. BS3]
MKKKLEHLESIIDQPTYDEAMAYMHELIDYATQHGYLSNPENDNEYTREIGRIGIMCADYESIFMTFKHLKVKNPLIISIENEMKKNKLNQRQAAELLEVKENTFSQIMTGKRNVSMKLAKRLYQKLRIDPKTILEFS